MSAVALLFFHIRPSPTLSTFLCCLYAVSSHRCCPSCLFASLPYKLAFLPFSVSLSLSLTHTHTHTQTHTHTHSQTLTPTLSSLHPSRVSFLTCMSYLPLGSADHLAQDHIR